MAKAKGNLETLTLPKRSPYSKPTRSQDGSLKAMTVRLTPDEYQRLRRYAFDHEMSHQAVFMEALDALLKAKGR